MTSPSTSFAQYRADLADTLEEFDLEADQMGFVGLRIAPVIDVGVVGGNYGKIELAELLKGRSTNRAPDGSYNRGEARGTKDTFACDEHGFEEAVDDRLAAMFADYWNAEQLAAQRTRDAVLRNHNQRVIDAALGLANTTAAGTAWSTVATATPIANIRAAKIAVRDRTGIVPNCMCLDWEAFEYLVSTAEVVDRVKHWGGTDPNVSSLLQQPSVVAAALGLEEILVSGSVKNTANEAQAASLSSQWTNTKALLFVRDDSEDMRRPRLMNTFHFTADGSQIGGYVETYRDEAKRSDIVRTRMDTDEKLVYSDCGQVITGVL